MHKILSTYTMKIGPNGEFYNKEKFNIVRHWRGAGCMSIQDITSSVVSLEYWP